MADRKLLTKRNANATDVGKPITPTPTKIHTILHTLGDDDFRI
jgi:hypothetical protein